jgi:flagellar hook-associated protein 3 FlgL
MRVSTSMIYDKGLAQIQSQTAGLLKTQQQLATGRRILTPSDDPIAAARALEVGQSKAVNQQFLTNQATAYDRLGVVESRLEGVGDILQYSRERVVQAGNAALGAQEREYIAADLREQFNALLAIGNSKDAQGDYVFSGFKTQTQPFVGDFGEVEYRGDESRVGVQVSAARTMPVSFAGSDVFSSIRLPDDPTMVAPAAANTGDGALRLSENSVAPDPGIRYEIEFDGTDYLVTRREPGQPDQAIAPVNFNAGPPPSIDFDGGVEFEIEGTPEEGDRFEVFVMSEDMFANFALFIDAIERPGAAEVSDGAVAFGLNALDGAIDGVLRVRAQIGSQMVEIDNLRSVGTDLNVQYDSEISRLQDVNWAEAVSRLSREQVFLEAAQQSYLRVTGLTLFNFIS